MSKRRKIFLILIALLILLGLSAAAAYYFGYFDKYFAPEPTPTETSEEPETTEVAGDFVSAKVPTGWTIVEYQNGAGTTMLTGGLTYSGLTALEVKNPAGDVVFAIHGVYGIGGTAACASYYRFADDSTSYYNAVVATNIEVSDPPPAVVDLSTTPYSAMDLFDAKVRRIGAKLYWDTMPANATFEAACGMQESLFDFGAPQFTIVGQGTSGLYQWVVLATASAEDLVELDAILNSLTVTP